MCTHFLCRHYIDKAKKRYLLSLKAIVLSKLPTFYLKRFLKGKVLSLEQHNSRLGVTPVVLGGSKHCDDVFGADVNHMIAGGQYIPTAWR